MFHGCYVAIVTPFRDHEIDFAALDRLVDKLLVAKVDGLVPCGTTGESPTLSEEEQIRVIAAVVKRVGGRAKVVAGTGSNCTEKTVASSRHAVEVGADGVMIVNPYYNKPTQEGLFRHISAVAEAVAKPIMLYNIPGRTGIELRPVTIGRIRSAFKHVVAVKHATGSIDGASELASQSDIAILSGDDPLTLPLMSIGAVGVVSVIGNLYPAHIKSLTDAALRGDWTEARRWHHKTYRLARTLLTIETNPMPIKTALAMKGEMAEEFRLPMCPMSPENRTRLANAIEEYDRS